jgi:exodeoxyribonuclease VII large subunit
VGIDCARARSEQWTAAARLREHGRQAILSRARLLATLSRAPAEHVERQRTRLHQELREIRAAGRRRIDTERRLTREHGQALKRRLDASLLDCGTRRPRELERLALALAGHDPQRTLERGYVLVQSPTGEPLVTAAAARAAGDVRLRFAEDTLAARIIDAGGDS